ncbi:MAG: hypothetical protein DSM106950_43665 [Stigonema ocellatum SAG 48.90 = DSM 106950]|nr:hypothetical protein [Stigonema ocellatum SAG 48.90 = DSM 106950]
MNFELFCQIETVRSHLASTFKSISDSEALPPRADRLHSFRRIKVNGIPRVSQSQYCR